MTWLDDDQKKLFGKVFDKVSILPKNRKNSLKLRNLSFFSTDTKSTKQMVPYLISLSKGEKLEHTQYYNALRNSGLLDENNKLNRFGEIFINFLSENNNEAYEAITTQKNTKNIPEKYIFPMELIVLLAVYHQWEHYPNNKLASFEIIENLNYFRINIADTLNEYEQRNFTLTNKINFSDDDLFLMLQGINFQGYEIKRLIHLREKIKDFKTYYIEAYESCPSDNTEITKDEQMFYDQIIYFKTKFQKDIRYRVKMAIFSSIILEGTIFPKLLEDKIFSSVDDKNNFIKNYNLQPIIDAYFKINNDKNIEIQWNTLYEQPLFDTQNSYSYNRIIFGAPGTGKSYLLNKQSVGVGLDNGDALLKDGGYYERVTFHPDYSYANFVGTYKPVPLKSGNKKEEIISYRYVPGPFMRLLVKAMKNTLEVERKPHLLIIEEINRANVAATFGDIFQLLDRNNGVSEYHIQATEDMKQFLCDKIGGKPSNYEKIKLPDNMFIWATMNSADQGVFPMDTAFKRRWDFTYQGINDGENDIKDYEVSLIENDVKINWNDLRKAINEELLNYNVNEDKLLGPHFISKAMLQDSQTFKNVFKNKVIMYLFDDAAKQKKQSLFAGASNPKLYSAICNDFDKKGVAIFSKEIRNKFITSSFEEEI